MAFASDAVPSLPAIHGRDKAEAGWFRKSHSGQKRFSTEHVRQVRYRPKEPKNNRTLFVKGKNNNAPRNQKALAYGFGVRDVGIDPDTKVVIRAPHVIWHPQHVDVSATEAMGQP